jgi:hypothetical protein
MESKTSLLLCCVILDHNVEVCVCYWLNLDPGAHHQCWWSLKMKSINNIRYSVYTYI